MASQTIRSERFPVGTSVSVYAIGNKVSGSVPAGSAVTSATVATDGTLSFSGLADGVAYTAYALVGSTNTYVDFTTDPAPKGEGALDKAVRLWSPATAQTFRRSDAVSNVAAPASGTLLLAGGVVLPAGKAISRIGFVSGTTALSVGTHQVFSIYRQDTRALLAATADDVATAWAANTAKELVLSAPYTPVDDIAVYLGLLVTATTVPSLAGSNAQNAALVNLAPIFAGTADAGLAGTVASLPATAAALTATAGMPWAYVK